MAVNISLVRGPPVRNRAGNVMIPAPYPDEMFVLRRDDTQMELKDDSGMTILAGKGSVHITNIRLVFVIGDRYINSSNHRSVELPFRGITGEELQQPIFGANNVSGKVVPYDDSPFLGRLNFKIYFKNGGMETFLYHFNHILSASRRFMRQQLRERQRQAQQPTHGESYEERYGVDYGEEQLMAFTDPNDPSEIYIVQPTRSVPPIPHRQDYNKLD